ncbi:MAG: hypothetical protein E3J54_00385 [Actinobacteria bacterium]|nr:MAG: hypothetical protein E3J54_00385 [Actinomycetota bacterium]
MEPQRQSLNANLNAHRGKHLAAKTSFHPRVIPWSVDMWKELTGLVIVAIFTITYLINPITAYGKSNLSVKLNQLVYESSDNMTIKVDINPTQNISDSRVTLVIGAKDDPVYSRTFFLGNLKVGTKKSIEFSKNNVTDFGLDLGKTSLRIMLTENQKTISKFSTEVGVKKKDVKGVINTALALKLADKPHIDSDKNITDDFTQKRILPKIEKYYKIASKNRGKINFIVSPMLAETIQIIANGYNLRETDKLKFMPDSSPSSLKAKRLIDIYNKLFMKGQANMIATSYSQIDCQTLLNNDLKDQIEQGKTILEKIFGLSHSALYINNYCNPTSSKSEAWIMNNATMGFKYLPATTPLLGSENTQASTMKVLAHLTQAINVNNNSIVLISKNVPKPENITHLLNTIKKIKWIKLVPLKDIERKTSTKKIKEINKNRKNSDLGKARANYVLLKEVFTTENKSFQKAQMSIYLAEDENTSAEQARILAKKAKELLDDELSKIVLKLSSLTLTGRDGKLPIKIQNDTNSKLKLSLVIKSKDLDVGKGKKTIFINPKENMLSIPVKVLKSGQHKVLVILKSKDKVVTKKYFLVSTQLPSVFWYYVAAIALLLFLIVSGAFYVRARRSKLHTKS